MSKTPRSRPNTPEPLNNQEPQNYELGTTSDTTTRDEGNLELTAFQTALERFEHPIHVMLEVRRAYSEWFNEDAPKEISSLSLYVALEMNVPVSSFSPISVYRFTSQELRRIQLFQEWISKKLKV